MSDVTIYHNPKCSKSRQTLDIIEDKGIKPQVILYLETPPSKDVLKQLLIQLKLKPRELMRIKEAEYKDNNLNDESMSDEALIEAMIKYPKLIERPLVTSKGKTVIGRPPENVLEIL